jgi:septal ring factor EnvC (AmiA/AmiB activator)
LTVCFSILIWEGVMATKSTDKGKNPTASPEASSPPVNTPPVKGFSAKPQPNPESATQPIMQEQQLEQTIDELQAKVTHQISTIEQLQAQLQAQTQQSQQLQASLEKAEAAARQLATLNETLIAENTQLKAQPKAAEPTQKEPVFPNGALPSGIPEQEIGWFD